MSITSQSSLDNDVYVDSEKGVSEILYSLKNAELMSYTIKNEGDTEVEVDIRMRPNGETLSEIFVNEQYQYPDMLYRPFSYQAMYEVRGFEVVDEVKGLLEYDSYTPLEKSEFLLSPGSGIQIRYRIDSFGGTKLCSEQVFDGDTNRSSLVGFVLESSPGNYIKINNSVEGRTRGLGLNEYNSYYLRLNDQVSSGGDVFRGQDLHSETYFSSSFPGFFSKIGINNNEEGQIPFSATMFIECETPSTMVYGKKFNFE